VRENPFTVITSSHRSSANATLPVINRPHCGANVRRRHDPQPSAAGVEIATLEKRLLDLERQLAALQQELQDLRREFQAQAPPMVVPMTPEEAVHAFQQDPDRLLTVEFGVASAGWLDGPVRIDEDPTPPIRAEWDGRLSNGGQFALYLTARAIRGLADLGIELPPATAVGLVDMERVGLICRHLKGKGVRVTGVIRASRPEDRYTDYSIVVDDPRHFAVNKQ
jgi:hypothetical protein